MKLKSTLLSFAFLLVLTEGISQTYTFTGVYTGKPRFNIETRRAGVFLGNIVVELFPNIAMMHTRNFDSLVSTGFYDTTAFHRAIPNFMIQGGDPNSRSGPVSTWGYGNPSQPTVVAEFSAAKHLRGILSAARSANPNSATSQFFICVANYASLNGNYSVYGRVVSGLNWADDIATCPKMATYTNTPSQKVEMFITKIGTNDTVPDPPVLNTPSDGSVDLDYSLPVSLSWNAATGGIIYEIQLSTDTLFTTLAIPVIKSSNLNYSFNNTTPGTKYFWRARTNNGGHFSVWSPVYKFKTLRDPEDPTGIGMLKKDAQQISVFPNPTSGSFTFENLEKGALLEIFDMNGKEIFKTIVTETTYNLTLNSKEKGSYNYQITNQKNKQKGKLLIQ